MSNYLLSHCNFIHIPKCGGTAINTVLWRLGAVTDHAQIIRDPGYGHLFASQMPENGKPFFSFVRHPVSWWLSYYHWNMNCDHSRFSEQEKKTISFDQWIQDYGQFWLGLYSRLVQRYLGKDPLFPTKNQVEFVGRTEHLFKDLQNIFNVIGQPYKENVMRDLLAGKIDLKPEWKNAQQYDRDSVSYESRNIIAKCERYMYSTFGYRI